MSTLSDAIKRFRNQFETADPVFLAKYVSAVSGEADTHWVDMLRPDGAIGERRKVRGKVTSYPGMIFRVGRDRKRWGPTEWAILGTDATSYLGQTSVPQVDQAPHGEEHGWEGADRVSTLNWKQIYPLRVQPDSDTGTWYVAINPGEYIADYEYCRIQNELSVDLAGYVPGVGSRYLTISLNSSGAAVVTPGPVSGTLTVADMPEAPSTNWPLCVILLKSTYTDIDECEFVDVRHLGTPRESGAGLWGNVVIVANSGGDFAGVQDGITGASAGDQLIVFPSTYSETITLAKAVSLWAAGTQRSGPVTISNASETLPVLTNLAAAVVKGLELYGAPTTGSGTWRTIDAKHTGSPLNLQDCKVTAVNGGSFSGTLVALDVAGDATNGVVSVIKDCYLDGKVYLSGGTVVIDGCWITDNIEATIATTLYIRNSHVTGNITGSGGDTLNINSSVEFTGSVSGWSTENWSNDESVYTALLAHDTSGTVGWALRVQAGGKLALQSLTDVGATTFVALSDTPANFTRTATTPSAGNSVKTAGTGATGAPGDRTWSNPSNVTGACDSVNASASSIASGDTTERLKATNFSFSVPSYAKIVGLKAVVKKCRNNTPLAEDINDLVIQLWDGTSLIGENKAGLADNGDPWLGTGVLRNDTYGSSTDTWGLALDSTLVNNSSFGIVISAKAEDTGKVAVTTANVDCVTITVYYTDRPMGPIINDGETALVWYYAAANLTELGDCPGGFDGQSGKGLVVNDDEDGIEFGDIALPSYDADDAYEYLRVKSTGLGREWTPKYRQITIYIGDQTNDIADGDGFELVTEFAGEIKAWHLRGDGANTIKIRIRKSSWSTGAGSFSEMTDYASGTATYCPHLAAAQGDTESTFTNWNSVTFSEGDILEFHAKSLTGTDPKIVCLTLKVQEM